MAHCPDPLTPGGSAKERGRRTTSSGPRGRTWQSAMPTTEGIPPYSPQVNGPITATAPTCRLQLVDQVGLPMWLPGHCSGTTPILVPPPPSRSAGKPDHTSPPAVTTHNTTYGTATHVQLPRAISSVARVLGYQHLSDFYAPDGVLRNAQDLRAWAPWGRTVHMVRDWLHRHHAALQPVIGAPAPRWQQAPKDWVPGPIRPIPCTAVLEARRRKAPCSGWSTSAARQYR